MVQKDDQVDGQSNPSVSIGFTSLYSLDEGQLSPIIKGSVWKWSVYRHEYEIELPISWKVRLLICLCIGNEYLRPVYLNEIEHTKIHLKRNGQWR